MGVLDEKVAIVTGSGRGVGAGIARALAREGARVAVVDIDAGSAEAVAAELGSYGVPSLAVHCDIRDSAQVDSCVSRVVEEWGTVDILVNNAVAARVGVPLQDVTDGQIAMALDSGPKATLYFMRACYPHLRGGGRVVNLRSGSEFQGLVGYGAYIASKAAIGGITRVAAREWGREGITVNNVCPFVLSPAAEAYFESAPGELDKVLEQQSIPRTGDAESDVGRAVVYLVGPDASYVTGMTLSVDGGGMFAS